MAAPLTGTVTYLLTDVVGSTALWEQAEAAMAIAMARHDELVASTVAGAGGEIVWPRGEGDSRFAVFAEASEAMAAAAALVRALGEEAWPTPYPLTVRAAVHTGEAEHRGGLYYGPAVNRASRLRAVAHPGQVLASAAAVAAAGHLAEGLGVRDLGRHRLADLTEPEHVHQLVGPGLPDGFPPPPSLDRVRHNLPRQRDEFVGRHEERAFLAKALEGSRLVTLTGPGGTGKTRLAVQLAAEQTAGYADGVWLVELAGVAAAEPDAVFDSIARAVGVPVVPGRTPAQLVEDFLRAKTTLLVLDNCEHLVQACAGAVVHLLQTSAGLRVLATSRRPLGVRGEQLWPLSPLDHPDPAHLPSVDELEAYDAVALFAARARTARPDFVLDAGTAPAVAEICSHLDGVPLALELAAATLRTLGPAEVAERLGDRFALLAADPTEAEAPAHHRSLRAALDWSWDLLGPAERVALRRLSVFASSFEFEAAEAVVAGDELPVDGVPDAVVELVDASLVVPSYHPSTRYRLLESVRAYAEEKLVAAGEQEAVRDRLLRWFADAFETAQAAEAKPAPSALIDRFALEADDVRAALAWGLKARRHDSLRLAGAVSYAWWTRRDLGEGLSTLPTYVDAFPDAPPRDRAAALASLTFLQRVACQSGRPHADIAFRLTEEHGIDEWWVYFLMCGSRSADVARQGYERALARGHQDAASYYCQQMGCLAENRDDLDAAARWYEEGYERLKEDRLSSGRARLLDSLVSITEKRGEREQAERMLHELLQLGLDIPDPIAEGSASGGLGAYALERGDFEAAVAYFTRELEISQEISLASLAAIGCRGMCDVHIWVGNTGPARIWAEDGVEAARVGLPSRHACFLADLAHTALLDGDRPYARGAVEESLGISRAMADGEHVAHALAVSGMLDLADGATGRAVAGVVEALPLFGDVSKDHLDAGLQAMGLVAASLDDDGAAVRFLAAADAARSVGRPPWDLPTLRRTLAGLRSNLGDEEFERETAAGRAWPLRTALAEALRYGSSVSAGR
ncbi:MAG: ATP-binding protein [Acidimicrobiales bacterium]